VEVAGGYGAGYGACLGDGLHERRSREVVTTDADDLWLAARCSEELLDGGVTEHSGQVPIERARGPSPLPVAENGPAGSPPEALLEDGLPPVDRHRAAIEVASALGDDHDAGPPADLASPAQDVAHRRLPVVTGRALRNEDHVGAGRQAAHQREVAA